MRGKEQFSVTAKHSPRELRLCVDVKQHTRFTSLIDRDGGQIACILFGSESPLSHTKKELKGGSLLQCSAPGPPPEKTTRLHKHLVFRTSSPKSNQRHAEDALGGLKKVPLRADSHERQSRYRTNWEAGI